MLLQARSLFLQVRESAFLRCPKGRITLPVIRNYAVQAGFEALFLLLLAFIWVQSRLLNYNSSDSIYTIIPCLILTVYAGYVVYDTDVKWSKIFRGALLALLMLIMSYHVVYLKFFKPQLGIPTVLADGAIELRGGIDRDTADKFEELLRQRMGQPLLFVISSTGGGVDSAIYMVNMMRVHGNVTVFVPDDAICMSACTMLFSGGVHRFAGANATFGFHACRIKEDVIAPIDRCDPRWIIRDVDPYMVERLEAYSAFDTLKMTEFTAATLSPMTKTWISQVTDSHVTPADMIAQLSLLSAQEGPLPEIRHIPKPIVKPRVPGRRKKNAVTSAQM